MVDENKLIKARLEELAHAAYRQNRYMFSHFLTPGELTALFEMAGELKFVDYDTYGGNESCERQMVRFGSERMFGYEEDYPISVLLIEPLAVKFAELLGHRDYLGAVMNLGIERDVLGDILIKDKAAYLFCMDSIADYVAANLDKIKHTNVKVSKVNGEIQALARTLKDMEVLVQSPRFDAVAAAVSRLSRSEAQQLFRDKKVLLDGRVCENNSMTLKEGSVFSIRGYGKYIYQGCGKETRKGRVYVQLKKYE
ncbi:MAG: hypothetical protein J6K58_16355 [Lachnospiraceae bacterium]|nr:hypothetical protein [Lachnospiraceae bacterium]